VRENYNIDISGGTGKFDGATGTIAYFGLADFSKSTLVLRYSEKEHQSSGPNLLLLRVSGLRTGATLT
jgi:hypothetical protein